MTKRRKQFRIAALCLGVMIPVAFELLCRVMEDDLSQHTDHGIIEYLGQRPLFVLNDDGSRWEVAKNRRAYFAADSFSNSTSKTRSAASAQPASTQVARPIFVLGGSTVQGRPYSLPTSFPTYMEIALQTAIPDEEWEVVNCGGVSYASYRLIPILKEVLQHNPAAIVVCTGHNEYLEFVTYKDAVEVVDMVGETAARFSNLASVRFVQSFFRESSQVERRQAAPAFSTMPIEVDALLDNSEGWARYQRAALHRDRIVRQFGRNLNQMVQLCRKHQVPLLLVSPPENLKDCPPFKSEFDPETDDDQQAEFLKLLASASDGRLPQTESEKRLRGLCSDQPRYALAWYRLGRSVLGRLVLDEPAIEEARTALQNACDEDVCPLRMTSLLHQELQLVVEMTDVPFIDLQSFFRERSRTGIVGSDWLVDHVHPSFAGHRKTGILLADRLLEILSREPAESDWQRAAEARMVQNLERLEKVYFLRGQRTLENLNGWARGRAQGTDLDESDDRNSERKF